MCFVDFTKAFDSISHDKLWVTMMDMGYHLHLIAGTLSEWFHVKKVVCQGCSFFVLVQHPSEDGNEGDPRWISKCDYKLEGE